MTKGNDSLYCGWACGNLNITGRDLADIYCGALLNDMGRTGMPISIPLKHGAFEDEEFRVMNLRAGSCFEN